MGLENILLNISTNALETANWFSIARKGGWLMIALLLISFLAIEIIIEKLIKLKKIRNGEDKVIDEVLENLKNDNVDKAINICEENSHLALGAIFAKAIDKVDIGLSGKQEVIDLSLKKEIHRMEKKLGTLATFSAIAPLIGFLGTVTGMVKVFMKLGEMGGGVDITLLANGIWEALITTIGGLSVGIICILFYNYLVSKIETMSQEIEDKSNDFFLTIRRMKDVS
jgi:biopolymer transport protein ExbB